MKKIQINELSVFQFSQCSLIYVLTSMSRPYYGNYRYPDFAVAIGWMIASASLVPLPICAAYTMWQKEGSLMEVCLFAEWGMM